VDTGQGRNVTARPWEHTAFKTFSSALVNDMKALTTCAASASENVVRVAGAPLWTKDVMLWIRQC
jgi:hypothetical protein